MSETIPWEDTYDMAKLMYLVYGYMKAWKINKSSDISSAVEELSQEDTRLLNELSEKYPKGEVLQYYTNKLDLQCVIGKNPKKKRYDIVFRGTDSLTDAAWDLVICQKQLEDGVKVHQGFYNQLHYGNVFDDMKQFIRQLFVETPDWTVYICGHSAGAADSTIASYLLSKEFPNITFNVFTFASPKVGNKKFKEIYNSIPNLNQLRICYNRDVVTSVPTFSYYHVGNNLWYKSGNETWYYYDKFSAFSYYIYYFYNVYDHSGIRYVNALEKDYNNPKRKIIFK